MNRLLVRYRERNRVPYAPCPASATYVVIPTHRESAEIAATLTSLRLEEHDATAIVVVNREVGDRVAADEDRATVATASSFPRTTVIEHEFPRHRGGVGAARRLGLDLAVESANSADAMLVCLDADTRVAPGFLRAVGSHQHPTGLARFEHEISEDAAIRAAVGDYESSQRYEALGLRLAGSPYAHVSLGSRIVTSVAAYVSVAGMPRRKAGEDFYFLQKLVKTFGALPLVDCALVRPSPRPSDRVPFGTGPSVMQSLRGDIDHTKVIPPTAFDRLGALFARVPALMRDEAAVDDLDAVTHEYLDELDIERNVAELRRHQRGTDAFVREFHRWFDGLRARQLLRLQTESLGEASLPVAVEELARIPRDASAEFRLAELRVLQPL